MIKNHNTNKQSKSSFFSGVDFPAKPLRLTTPHEQQLEVSPGFGFNTRKSLLEAKVVRPACGARGGVAAECGSLSQRLEQFYREGLITGRCYLYYDVNGLSEIIKSSFKSE